MLGFEKFFDKFFAVQFSLCLHSFSFSLLWEQFLDSGPNTGQLNVLVLHLALDKTAFEPGSSLWYSQWLSFSSITYSLACASKATQWAKIDGPPQETRKLRLFVEIICTEKNYSHPCPFELRIRKRLNLTSHSLHAYYKISKSRQSTNKRRTFHQQSIDSNIWTSIFHRWLANEQRTPTLTCYCYRE